VSFLGSKEVAVPQEVVERGLEPSSQSTVETPEVSSKAPPVIPIAGVSAESSKSSETYDEEADTVKSMGSDQSDEIETRSINGDGGDYVLLGTTGSPERDSPRNIDMLPMPGELQVMRTKTTKRYRDYLIIHVAVVH
jgi:hypothetical protein